MDGRIVGQKYKPFADNSVPPAKIEAGDSSSKITEFCSDVTPQTNTSSNPVMSPDRASSVFSMDCTLPKAPDSFDFRFVASDDEVRQLLVARTGDENRDVTLISHPDDLSQANLVSRLSISEEGRHTLRSGKLFEGSQPLTLVMDIRKLSSEELPKFNDLLDPDTPCLFDKASQKKRPLGEHVSLLVLADPEQLASVGLRDDVPAAGAPGADFWRRINRPGNTWQLDAQTGKDPSMDVDKVGPLLAELPCAESAMDDDSTVLIDCHMHNSWRQLLLGGPGVDQQGRIRHVPGRLECLRAGQRVILKGANWQDLAFEQTLRQMLAQRCFESNGKICGLPDDVQFYQMSVDNNELHSLFQTLSCPGDASGNPIIINQSNISEWLNPIAIAPEGYAAPNNCLLEQIRAGGVVTVTSALTEALWFRLLGSLQTIRETTDLEPRLQVVHSRQQPKALGLPENGGQPLSSLQEKTREHTAFDIVTYHRHAQASHWINDQQEAPLVIQINEQTGFSQLFDNIHITSEQKAHFGRRQSGLQKALTAGTPVVLRRLETNPMLQQLLEPLALSQPLLVNGQLQAFPQARVTILWPKSVKSLSSVLDSMVATAAPCPDFDIWDINADRHDIPRTELPEQALYSVYKAFNTVPAHLCNPLPEITEDLLNNLILAARRAQQVDQSPLLLPGHWRKAISSVITHGTRQHASVRDFMKVACWHSLPDVHKTPAEDQTTSVDPDQLATVINGALRLDRQFMKQNFWQLARAFDPVVFKGSELQVSYKSPFPVQGEKEVLDRFCAMILAHAPEEKRQAMAYQLAVNPAAAEPWQSLTIRPTRQIKRLQDALASGWQLTLFSGQTRSHGIQSLATDCFHIARTANSDAAGIEHIKNRLSESLAWTGSTDKPLATLADDLYHGLTNQKDRESRRLSRLHERFADSPVIFLQGETGTGKSYFSAKMAKASGQAAVISLGPSDSEQTLMKRWQWQEHSDGDRSMTLQNRALMEWANTPSGQDGHYVTLVLDEANLAKAGLLASLNGLWEPQPCIYVNGHPVKVGPKHRVILTGNPDHYAGRQMSPALKEKLPRAYYPRLDQAFLRDRVVEPALVKHLQRHLPAQQINDIAHSAAKTVMALWKYYQELLPGREFTPRDLTDICSWVGWYLDRALSKGDRVTCEQINSLIQQSFRDVLGPEITKTHQDALSALEIWFAARYQPEHTLSDRVRNKTLSDIQQTFSTVTREIRPDFDTSGSAVCELVQQLGQDLSRCQQAYHQHRKHGGRQATLITGPAGRGKDATLSLVIESVRQQAEQQQESMPGVFTLNACDCSWDRVCEAIQKAKVDGGIVVISEMNLIDSQHLEGELNDILAGDAHPGFHLFATINPPEYSGRKPLSPALKGRFRHLPIRQYNPTELQAIAGKVLPQNPEGKILAKELTQQHCRLRAYLQQQNLPLQPTSLDLQNVARAVARESTLTDKRLLQCFHQHYRLYLMAAKISLAELPGSSAPDMGEGALESELCHWFNETVSGIDRPWLIRHSDRNSIDEQNHEIRVNTYRLSEKVKTEIIRMVAQAKWQASGLPLKPHQSYDILTRALYRHWQQRWFGGQFGQTGVDVNCVFSMTKEEEQTLKAPASPSYVRKADQRIAAWKANEVQCWPAFWHQISDLPNQWVDDSERYNPEVEEKKAKTLDQETDYKGLNKLALVDYKIFDTQDYPSHMNRCRAIDTYVTANGDIKRIVLDDKYLQGFETLIPTSLPGRDQTVTLARDQTLATLELSSENDNGEYPLPSLRANDYIVALRLEPNLAFTLVRGRYTGLHILSITEPRANQSIHCTYVVEPRESDNKTAAEGVQPEQSTHFDVHCSEGMKTVLDRLFKTIEDRQDPTEEQLPLWKIKNAKNTTQRIEAISEYCRQFAGDAQPESNKNFFEFLVTQRQGSCRHRVPVFVALCRYFEIPCRQVGSLIHVFAEYSPDEGQTWNSVDLGGAPRDVIKIEPVFQTTRRISISSSESKKIKDLLKRANLAQLQALAKALDMNFEKLKEALETNSALPETNLSLPELARKLWEQGDLTSFSLSVSIIESMETTTSGHLMKQLTDVLDGTGEHTGKRMSEVIAQALSESNEDQVIEPLKSLHSKMIVQGKANPRQWLSSMVDLLKDSDLSKPSVIHLAREALKSGWLDPLPTCDGEIIDADEHHELLVSLEGIDELKLKAGHCLKKWYKELLSAEKNSQIWRLTYESFVKREGTDLIVDHSHDGVSSLLENKIASPSIQISWTDEPEGVPDIERMLLQHPAFGQLISGNTNHRRVIILGEPCWEETVIAEKSKVLFQRVVENSQELQQLLEKIKTKSPGVPYEDERLEELKRRCCPIIQQAFSHYLYKVTHSKDASLTYCWVNAHIRMSQYNYNYGTHDPSSPEELDAMMGEIDSDYKFEKSIKDGCLRQALNADNALVLRTDDLTKIADEFLNTVNLNSMCDSEYLFL
ncbi:AAA family ATPase [Endozoicomonas sp. 8E]|uniref:AAA family ATPase n=1 Tax=Endozoicomonas sp. 8E TaxID=3035692 RepID=UPI00293915F7|nr:AAA family ATPase [Endozoicomonas sp. 8E]WOG28846.1 AAA family ATPase [Endozoicomonas sp. 8E]